MSDQTDQEFPIGTTEDDFDNVDGDPSVPTDLLELHVELEDAGMSPEEFKEVFGNESRNKS